MHLCRPSVLLLITYFFVVIFPNMEQLKNPSPTPQEESTEIEDFSECRANGTSVDESNDTCFLEEKPLPFITNGKKTFKRRWTRISILPPELQRKPNLINYEQWIAQESEEMKKLQVNGSRGDEATAVQDSGEDYGTVTIRGKKIPIRGVGFIYPSSKDGREKSKEEKPKEENHKEEDHKERERNKAENNGNNSDNETELIDCIIPRYRLNPTEDFGLEEGVTVLAVEDAVFAKCKYPKKKGKKMVYSMPTEFESDPYPAKNIEMGCPKRAVDGLLCTPNTRLMEPFFIFPDKENPKPDTKVDKEVPSNEKEQGSEGPLSSSSEK